MHRDNKGRFTKKASVAVVLIGFASLIVAGAVMGGTTTAYTATITETIIERDNVDKLMDNLEEKIRAYQDAQALLARSQTALDAAQNIERAAMDEYNQAVQAVNLYQGVD